jgi:uncharacterized membrane protein YhaH (DUF805 family)
MLKTYFGDWGTGTLQRLPYLGYHVLLMVLIIAVIFGGLMVVGTTENILGGDLASTQKMLMDKFGIVAVIATLLLVFVVMFGQINILGKRIRDMGLPVLWTILGIILISIILNTVFPPEEVTLSASAMNVANASTTEVTATSTSSMIVQAFDMLIFLCLILIPSNTFKNKKHY